MKSLVIFAENELATRGRPDGDPRHRGPRDRLRRRGRHHRGPPRRGRTTVTVVEEGPGSTPTPIEPFSLEEMVAKYRHHGASAALGNPADRLRRGPVRRAAAPRSTAASGTACPTTLADEWRGALRHRRVHARGARPLRRPRRAATSASRPCRAHRRRRRRCSSGGRPSSAGATSSSPGCSATTPPAAAPSRRCRARCCPGPWAPGRGSSPTAASNGCVRDGDRVVGAAGSAPPRRRRRRAAR